jgi:hypothetical protein
LRVKKRPGNDGSEVGVESEEPKKINPEGFSTDRESSPIGREGEIKATQRGSTGRGSVLSVESIGREKEPEKVRRLLYR